MMNRRTFLTTTPMIASALAIAPKLVLLNAPVLYGDGIHDDTAALQAWGKGKTVVWSNGERVGCRLDGKRFLMHDTLTINRPGVYITNCAFQFGQPNPLPSLLTRTIRFSNHG